MVKRISFILLSTLFVTTLSLNVQAASRKRKETSPSTTDTNPTAPKAAFGARVRSFLSAAGAFASGFWEGLTTSSSASASVAGVAGVAGVTGVTGVASVARVSSSSEASTSEESKTGEASGEGKDEAKEEKKTPVENTDQKRVPVEINLVTNPTELPYITLINATGDNYARSHGAWFLESDYTDERENNISFLAQCGPDTVLYGLCHKYQNHNGALFKKFLEKNVTYVDTKTIIEHLPSNISTKLDELKTKTLPDFTGAITNAFDALQKDFGYEHHNTCNNSIATLVITGKTLHITTVGPAFALLAAASEFKKTGGLQDSRSDEEILAARKLFVADKPKRPELTPNIYSRVLDGSERFVLFVGQSFLDTYGISLEEIATLINTLMTQQGLTSATITNDQANILVQEVIKQVVASCYSKHMKMRGLDSHAKLSLSVIFLQPKIASSSSSSSSSTSSSSSSSSSSSRSSTVAPTVVTAALTPVTLLTTPPTLTTLPIPSTPSSSLSPLDRVISKIIDTKHCTKEAAQAHYDKFVEAARKPMTEKSEFEAALNNAGITLHDFQATLPVDDVD